MRLPNNIPGDTARAANALCRQCGMCCDGTLFANVTVGEREKTARGLEVRKREDNKFVFHQPCAKFSEANCTIYSSRPAKCRSYHCKLQKKVMNGSLSLEEGLTIVSSVKSGVADLMPWAREKSKKDLKAISIRGFLGWYHKTTVRFAGRQNLSATDMDHVLGAFEYLKLVDRYFETTRLLAGFADLIQNFPAEETIPPNGSEE